MIYRTVQVVSFHLPHIVLGTDCYLASISLAYLANPT